MKLALSNTVRRLWFWWRGAPSPTLAVAPAACDECRQLQGVLDSVCDGVLACDAQGRLVLVNATAAALLDIAPRRPGTEQEWPDGAIKVRPTLEQALVEGEAIVELEIERGGRTVLLEGRANSILSQAGRPDGAVLVLRDVTRFRELAALRADGWEALAHDLKVPLNSISGFTTLLLQEAVGPLNALQRDFLRTIEQEGQRLIQAVQGFLEDARAGGPSERLNRAEAQIGPITDAAIERVRSLAVRKSLTIDVQAPEGLPTVEVDPDKISLVLVNLLDNAISFSREGARISVTAREVGDCLEVSVQDEGVGIPPDSLELVFGRFYRASNQPSGGRPGVGLGLAICKQVVERHGGRIWAESNGPNTGARLTFTLPVAYRQARLEVLGAAW